MVAQKMVFSFTDGRISTIAEFADSTLNDYFGLPSWIPADAQGRWHMAYDEMLAERIREALAGEKAVDEIKMIGGLCFMVGGHMAVGIVGDELMVRVGAEGYERALGRSHAREMDFTGRPMRGFVLVAPAGIKTERSLVSWIAPAVDS